MARKRQKQGYGADAMTSARGTSLLSLVSLLVLAGVGAGGGYVFMRRDEAPAIIAASMPLVVSLPGKEMVERHHPMAEPEAAHGDEAAAGDDHAMTHEPAAGEHGSAPAEDHGTEHVAEGGAAAHGEGTMPELGAGQLAPAPLAEITETIPGVGEVPRLGKDGRQAWQVYARPFDAADTRPRIAIVVSELGLSADMTEAASRLLDPAVTFAFLPFPAAAPVKDQVVSTRAEGHEALVMVPMEPADYPASDPGPNSLLVHLTEADNRTRLLKALAAVPGAVGILPFMGDGFLADGEMVTPLMNSLRDRGLLYMGVGSGSSSLAPVAHQLNVTFVHRDLMLDEQPTAAGVAAELAKLEEKARHDGAAVAVTRPYPVVLQAIANWTRDLGQRGIALAPLSAVINHQP
ncbi:divergent polysaccharide deacetylase family protein [Radicibacter daui]|uniref:divergent polysaccharide deacetylase family protein n=1 Tax=Radicibacter daui TaxID=3064829 RepID=UPI0040469656